MNREYFCLKHSLLYFTGFRQLYCKKNRILGLFRFTVETPAVVLKVMFCPRCQPLSHSFSYRLSDSPEAQLWPSSGNPNPYYLPHYSKLHNGDLFPSFDPRLLHIKPPCADIHIYSKHPTFSSVCLFIPAASLSDVQSVGDQVSTGLCLPFCARAQRWVHTRHHSHYTSFPIPQLESFLFFDHHSFLFFHHITNFVFCDFLD